MNQYCRYCAFCFWADDYRCSNHPKGKKPHWREKDIKRLNKCENFALTTDIITGKAYNPRKDKSVVYGTQFEQIYFDEFIGGD